MVVVTTYRMVEMYSQQALYLTLGINDDAIVFDRYLLDSQGTTQRMRDSYYDKERSLSSCYLSFFSLYSVFTPACHLPIG